MTEVVKVEPPKTKAKYVSTATARKLIRVMGFTATLPTLITWCKKYRLGRLVGGRWYVRRELLIRFLREGELIDAQIK